jgi:hypothetical protein
MCGGDLALVEGSSIATCEFCGTTQTVPNQDNEKKLALFTRANQHRSDCEFDVAAGVYESIIADFPGEAEAYWGLVLCKYGIEYVDDPATGKKIPTCHRSSFEPVMDDKDFEQVMDTADAIARKVYREEARQIEEIRKSIIAVSAKEDPYDIFICYKETDEKGQRTIDSVMAQDLYTALTEKGYRVFFSRISLEDKLGQEYEPYIFAALNSARVMLAIGTDYEHFNAVWVKNEWNRYLKLIAKGEKKTLIPCYKDIDAYDMPKEFRTLQAQDLGKVGATQDLLRGIEKVLNEKPQKPAAVGMTKEEKTMVEAMSRGAKQTRLLLTFFLLAFIFGFASAIVVALTNFEVNPSHYWAAYYTSAGQAVFYDGYNVMIMAAYYALNSIGLTMICTYGLRNKATHLINFILYAVSAVVFLAFAVLGYVPGVMLILIAVVNAIMTLLAALVASKEVQRTRNVYCGIWALLTIIIIASFLL